MTASLNIQTKEDWQLISQPSSTNVFTSEGLKLDIFNLVETIQSTNGSNQEQTIDSGVYKVEMSGGAGGDGGHAPTDNIYADDGVGGNGGYLEFRFEATEQVTAFFGAGSSGGNGQGHSERSGGGGGGGGESAFRINSNNFAGAGGGGGGSGGEANDCGPAGEGGNGGSANGNGGNPGSTECGWDSQSGGGGGNGYNGGAGGGSGGKNWDESEIGAHANGNNGGTSLGSVTEAINTELLNTGNQGGNGHVKLYKGETKWNSKVWNTELLAKTDINDLQIDTNKISSDDLRVRVGVDKDLDFNIEEWSEWKDLSEGTNTFSNLNIGFGFAYALEFEFKRKEEDVVKSATLNTQYTEVSVKTIGVDSTDTNSITLRGDLVNLDNPSCNVFFKYKKPSANTWNYTNKVEKTSEGEFTIDITGLDPDTEYQFKAVGEII